MPVWIRRLPAMRLRSEDLPTPSGPIRAIIAPARNGEGDPVERDHARHSAGDARRMLRDRLDALIIVPPALQPAGHSTLGSTRI